MNTNPAETKLALWLEDELDGEELAAFDAAMASDPARLAEREEIRAMRAMIASSIPASEEPPHVEFFTGRISRAIRSEGQVQPAAAKSWRAWFMPLAACAGMALAFLAGNRMKSPSGEVDVAGAPRAIPVEPVVYTPENGVEARCFASSGASATVIVLDGVQAIPDDTDFWENASINTGREIDATADIDSDDTEEIGL